MTKQILIRLTTVLSVIFLSGCFTIYKNRNEFSKASGVEKLTFTTPRSLDVVVASLQKQFVACNMSGQTLLRSSGYRQSTLTNTMSIKKVSPIKAELNYQLKTSNAMGEPEGGQWAYVANLTPGVPAELWRPSIMPEYNKLTLRMHCANGRKGMSALASELVANS